ncbi:MAG TPA: pirin family protein [Acidimicrobiales bacterium]|nr:pirin family protein [Acidimicrobiales bacterium]
MDDTGVEIRPSHHASVGAFNVRRALPQQGRRTVGPWCFADHMGPADVTEEHGLDIGPHPHTGLHTVTWLIDGEALHRDSLGSEQVITPGQLNLMTAGHGVSHAEEATGRFSGQLEGIQLWLAQPGATRDGSAAFAHVADPPRVEVGQGLATVFLGSLAGVTSPARVEVDLVGAEFDLRGAARVALRPDFEHALIVLEGAVEVRGTTLTPGNLGVLPALDELEISSRERTRAILIGGVPLGETLFMWWNFVARSRDEVTAMRESWQRGDDRFGRVASALARIDAPAPYWS